MPCKQGYVFLTNGRRWGEGLCRLAFAEGATTGILYQFPSTRCARRQPCTMVSLGCYLDEATDWSMTTDELRRIADDLGAGDQRSRSVVINPGNPTSCSAQDHGRGRQVAIAGLCMGKVYQDNLCSAAAAAISFRNVEMAPKFSHVTKPKGYTGECGTRGGYFGLLMSRPM